MSYKVDVWMAVPSLAVLEQMNVVEAHPEAVVQLRFYTYNESNPCFSCRVVAKADYYKDTGFRLEPFRVTEAARNMRSLSLIRMLETFDPELINVKLANTVLAGKASDILSALHRVQLEDLKRFAYDPAKFTALVKAGDWTKATTYLSYSERLTKEQVSHALKTTIRDATANGSWALPLTRFLACFRATMGNCECTPEEVAMIVMTAV